MGQQFAAAMCHVPGFTRRKFRKAVYSKVSGWSDQQVRAFCDRVSDADPLLVFEWEDIVSDPDDCRGWANVIADSMLETWDDIKSYPQQYTVITLEDDQYYMSAGPDCDAPEVMRHIYVLAASGFDALGVEP